MRQPRIVMMRACRAVLHKLGDGHDKLDDWTDGNTTIVLTFLLTIVWSTVTLVVALKVEQHHRGHAMVPVLLTFTASVVLLLGVCGLAVLAYTMGGREK